MTPPVGCAPGRWPDDRPHWVVRLDRPEDRSSPGSTLRSGAWRPVGVAASGEVSIAIGYQVPRARIMVAWPPTHYPPAAVDDPEAGRGGGPPPEAGEPCAAARQRVPDDPPALARRARMESVDG